MKLWIGILLFFQVNLIFAHDRETILGEVNANSRLALQDLVEAAPCPNVHQEQTRTFTVNERIYGVLISDIVEGPSVATVTVVSGGIGQSEITLRFRSPIQGHGLRFRVSVFGW